MRALLFALTLGGCTTGFQVKNVPLGDGRIGVAITCTDAPTIATCYQRAAAQCPGGFDVVSASEVPGKTGVDRSMMVSCK